MEWAGRGVRVVVVLAVLGTVVAGTAMAAPAVQAASPPAEGPTDSPTPVAGGGAAAASTANATVEIVFFYSSTCPACDNVEEYLAEQREEYDVRVEKYRASEHSDRLSEYLREYDVPQDRWGYVPTVFVGDEYAIGSEPSIELIESHLEAAGQETATTEPTPNGTSDGSSEGLAGVTILGLAGMALADAVNPCAFAVLLVLLTTILTRHPDRRGEVLKAGLAFALAVGLTYGAMGVLLVGGLKSAASIGAIDIPWLRRAFGVLAIALGLLNLKDAVSYGVGGFAMEVPDRWRPAMQRRLTDPLWSRRRVTVGAALAGVGVSLFLLPCTAGPYVVAGGLLADLSWTTALPLLALYNLVFIAPMIAITVAVGGGIASADAIGDWREEHIEGLHLIAGLLLIALGVALAAGLL